MHRIIHMFAVCLCAIALLASIPRSVSASKPDPTRTVLVPSDDSQHSYYGRYDTRGVLRAAYNIQSAPYEGAPEQVARMYLQSQPSFLGIESSQLQLQTEKVHRVPGGTHVRFMQTYEGIPVYRGDIVVSMNERNEIGMVINNARSDVVLSTTSPAFDRIRAMELARQNLNIKGQTLGKDDEATLVVFEREDGGWHLAYRITMTNSDPYGDWEVILDAMNGQLLKVENLFVNSHHVQGSGHVFLPDPLSKARKMYNSPGFTDGDDADTDSLTFHRTHVVLDSISFEDGVYKLKGPFCHVTDIEPPYGPSYYSATTPDGFSFTRSQQEFEAVMVYYHISTAYQHLRQLGFEIPSLREIRVDPHGYYGQDNSHYSPSGNWISFGEGGVDDAEDADVIWHEYAHAIQFNIVPTWGGGESGALGEGFGDYWAASYSRALGQWEPGSYHFNWVFNWDGHNPFWAGRILNDTRTYPFTGLPIHSAGQIWSAALMGIWDDLGRDVTDRLVIKSLMYLGSGATARDNAHAIIQADRDLYGGAHIATLLYWLGTVKRFIEPADYLPTLSHTPLSAIQNTEGPYRIHATINSAHGIGNGTVYVHWSWNNEGMAAAPMERVSSSEFVFDIPGTGTEGICRYYLVATDNLGFETMSPANAPAAKHRFQAGVDDVPPTINHVAPFVWSFTEAAVLLEAMVTDNTEVDSVWIAFIRPGEASETVQPMVLQGDDTFTWKLPVAVMGPGDTLLYRFIARDGSDEANSMLDPTEGYYPLYLKKDDPGEHIPAAFKLHQNYPNPFNPSTTIEFALPEPSFVTLTIFNTVGEQIITLTDGLFDTGVHGVAWSGNTATNQPVASGVYFYKLETRPTEAGPAKSLTRKMLLMR